jgi:serine protease AprX
VVVAAGHYGRDGFTGSQGYWTITSPANDPYVITVGAMKTLGTVSRGDDQIASYSSKGPTLFDSIVKPDLVAPGNHVASLLAGLTTTLAQTYPANLVPSSYVRAKGPSTYIWLSGTSMAAPVVSGAAALLLQQNSQLTPDQIKARFMKTAGKTFPAFSTVTDGGVTYTSQYDVFTVGAGYLDVAAALGDQSIAQGAALSPAAVYDAVSSRTYLIAAPASVWSASAAWGFASVWGSHALLAGVTAPTGLSTVWGTSAAWGSSAAWGTSAAWGSSAAWGTSAAWGSSAAVGNGEM